MIDRRGMRVAFPVSGGQSLTMTGTQATHPMHTGSKETSRTMSDSGGRVRLGVTRIGVSKETVRGGT
jgi:hypothetical protein